jgi:propionate CoA-transferase
VLAIVNYDNFSITPEVLDHYIDMVRDLVERFYCDVTRYTTSSFMRAKLGAALEHRHVAPHIYETALEALAVLEEKSAD